MIHQADVLCAKILSTKINYKISIPLCTPHSENLKFSCPHYPNISFRKKYILSGKHVPLLFGTVSPRHSHISTLEPWERINRWCHRRNFNQLGVYINDQRSNNNVRKCYVCNHKFRKKLNHVKSSTRNSNLQDAYIDMD